MPEPGGSAAIYGILYQILANLWRVSEIQLNATLDGEEIRSARLILEPKGGGGDARYEGDGIRVVEQYKTRSGRRRWSLKDLIEDVLPNLFVDIDHSRPPGTSQYRFMTDGRGDSIHSPNFQRFLQIFESKPALEDILDSLDDTQECRFFKRGNLTARALFLYITNTVRPKGDQTEDAIHHRKVWHLLAGFEFDDRRTTFHLIQDIDRALMELVDADEDVEAKRRELCTILMELAAQGNVTCTPGAILDRAQLNVTSLSDTRTLKIKLREKAEKTYEVERYDKGKDVRRAPDWPNGSHVFIMAGESGQGKTWQLLSLMDSILASGGLAVFIPSSGDADRDLQEASDAVWQRGFGCVRSIKFSSLADVYRKVNQQHAEGWLTVCIDDVQKPMEARRLVKQPWKRWGIRLALTVPSAVGEALDADQFEDVHVREVPDFTPSEARECLERRGYDWGEIPDDVRDILRRPILVELYCRVAETGRWAPQNEYEIYEGFWQRVIHTRCQSAHHNDRGILLQLVRSVINEGARYPWSQDFSRESGLSDAVLNRLESIGWLRRGWRGDVAIWHDRLLNWAIAEWLIDQRRTEQIDRPELAELLCRMYRNRPDFAGKRLGYVPMDYLWLACDPRNGVEEDVPFVLSALETDSSHGGNPETLYTVVVPTLGERGYPALIERLRASASHPDEQYFISDLIGQTVVKIGERSPEFARDRALDLIHNQEFVFRAAGMHILKALPDPQALDALWALHRQHIRALSDSVGIEGSLRCERSFAALRACVRLTPQWLAQKIRNAEPAIDPVSELAWLLWDLARPEAKDLWHQLKTLLFEKVAPDKPRSLICCIGRFKDTDELPRAIGWLDCQDDYAQPAAFSALCQLDPHTALNTVQELDDALAALTSSWWLPELLFRIPRIAHERLLAVAKQRTDGHHYLADVYAGHENLIDGATLEFYLDALEAELAAHPAQSIADGVPGVTHCLRLLANIHRPDLLRAIEARARTPLAALISKVAQSQLPHGQFTMDPLFEKAREVLYKLGSQHLTDLINSELASQDPQIRQMGMADALRRPDARTRALLRSIAQSEELCGNPPQLAEQCRAIEVLAALGDEEAVIQGVLRWGRHVPRSILSYWHPQRPMAGPVLGDVLHALGGRGDVDNALIAAGVSGNRLFVPVVRQVLRQALPESQTAWCAATTLMALDDTSEEFIDLLTPLLATPDNGHWAVEYLSRIGSSRALETLVQHLHAVGTHPFSRYDWRLAMDLSRRVEIRGRMNKLIVDRIKAGNDPWLKIDSRYLQILPELELDDACDILLEEAFASDPPDPTRVLRAITGLWKLDPHATLHGAELALQRIPEIKGDVPRLLVDLAGEQAIAVLCRHTLREESLAMRWCIARALRLVSNSESLDRHIREMLSSRDKLVREVAVEICGWQPPGFMQETLQALAGENFFDSISRTAMEALQRQEEQRWVEQLMQEFQANSTARRWSLLTSILNIGDPYLLVDRRDQLWIGRILAGTHQGYWEFAKKTIKERKQQVLDNAKSIDRGKR